MVYFIHQFDSHRNKCGSVHIIYLHNKKKKIEIRHYIKIDKNNYMQGTNKK